MARYNDKGQEIPNLVPVSVPHDWDRPLTLQEEIRRMVRNEFSRSAAAEGKETFEEADDFEVDEDPDPISPYEVPDAPPEWINGVKDADADPPPDPSKASTTGDPEPPKAPTTGDQPPAGTTPPKPV